MQSPQGEGRAYVLGSVHVGPTGGWRYPDSVSQAFAESDTLVVEYDPLVSSAHYLFESGRLPPGQSLTDWIEADTWERTRPHLAAAGIPESEALKLKPWLLAVSLNAALVSQLGYTSEQGVDIHFLGQAHAQQARAGVPKRIVELESLVIQSDIFDGLSPRLQDLMLQDALISQSQRESLLLQLMSAWHAGDEARMRNLLFASVEDNPEFSALYDVLITGRNANMVDQLDSMIRDGGTHFVVVGALHVTGEEGIISSLVRRGMKAERVNTH